MSWGTELIYVYLLRRVIFQRERELIMEGLRNGSYNKSV